MTTISLSKNARRVSKFVVAATLFSLVVGLVPAGAVVLSDSQAKYAAAAITAGPASGWYNQAVTVAQSVTVNTGPIDAAANAAKIVEYLSPKARSLLAGRVGTGVALNYPNQLPLIAMQLARPNENIKSSSIGVMIYQLGSAGGFDQSTQIAFLMSGLMHKNEGLRKYATAIANSLMAAVCNRADISAEDRANQLAYIAANLSVGLSSSTKASQIDKALSPIQQSLSFFLVAATAGNPNAEALIYNSIGNYALTLKNTLSGVVSPAMINILLAQAGATFAQMLPGSAAIINQAIVDVMTNNTGSIVNTGGITHPETPYVDPSR